MSCRRRPAARPIEPSRRWSSIARCCCVYSESAPSQAGRGITNALDHSQGAIDKLDATVAKGKDNGGGGNSGGNSGGSSGGGGGNSGGNGGGGGGNSGGNSGGGGGGGGNGGPAASQDPQATPTPGAVPRTGADGRPGQVAQAGRVGGPSGEPGGGKP